MPAIQLSDIQISKSMLLQEQDAVCNLLKQYGVLSVKEMYDHDVIERMNADYEKLLGTENSYVRKIDYSTGRAVAVQMDKMNDSEFPAVAEVFRAGYFESLTQAYLGRKDVHANQSMYVVNDIVGTRHHANDLHFDVQRSLKFFVYLSDTTAENGAFSCVPGSHAVTRKIRLEQGRNINYENRELSRQLPVKETDAIPVEGTAGTLIIFDTDVFHRAGVVSRGERKVMRAQSNFSDELNYPGEKKKGQSFFKKLFG